MKKSILTRITLLICLAWFSIGHASEKGDWEKAAKKGTSEAYLEFVRKHPKAPQVAEANQRIRAVQLEIQWQSAVGQNTSYAIEEYLRRNPDSPNKDEARERLKKMAELEAWESVKRADNERDYKSFIAKYPSSSFATEAASRADAASARVVEAEWTTASKINKTHSYQYFLDRNPNAPQAVEAKQRLESFIAERERSLVGPLRLAVAQATELRAVPIEPDIFAKNIVIRASRSVLNYEGARVSALGDVYAKRPNETAFEAVTAKTFAIIAIRPWPDAVSNVVAHSAKGSWPIGYVGFGDGDMTLIIPRELIPCELEFVGSIRTRIPFKKK